MKIHTTPLIRPDIVSLETFSVEGLKQVVSMNLSGIEGVGVM